MSKYLFYSSFNKKTKRKEKKKTSAICQVLYREHECLGTQ